MNLIYIRKSAHHRSCNCCYASNFNVGIPDIKRVDVLYDVQIGTMVPALCRDCLTKLYGAVGDVVGTSFSSDDDVDCYCE